MIHGIGVDILHVPRITRVLSKAYGHALARRILTRKEHEVYAAIVAPTPLHSPSSTALPSSSSSHSPSPASSSSSSPSSSASNSSPFSSTSSSSSSSSSAPSVRQVMFLSTRWALKEAAWKAARLRTATWKDVEVSYTPAGAPLLTPTNGGHGLGLGLEFKCSVSHDGDYLIAYVHAIKNDADGRYGEDSGRAERRQEVEGKRSVGRDKRGTGEMISEHERDFPRHHEAADEWISKW